MQTTTNQREDSCNAHSSDERRGTTQTIVRFFSRTHAVPLLAAVACALPAQSQPAIVPFDPPGSVSTIVGGISPEGMITGGYTDIYTNNHAFLRTPDGQFTTFDAPGASTNISPSGVSINSAGVITGNYLRYGGVADFGFGPEAYYLFAGFLRLADGTISNIDPPNSYESGPSAINDQGTIVGSYGAAADGSNHFYERAANGTFTEFNPEPGRIFPGSIAINPEGTVTGSYYDTNFISHSFLRTAQGLTLFDHPNAAFGTGATSISPNGAIAGYYYADTNYIAHGFVRNQNGQFTTFDVQGSIGTYPIGIAPNGTIAGGYNDANYQSHGFVRAKNGNITTFDPEGSLGTIVSGINPGGMITGYYFYNTNYQARGFVFQTKVD
jgi:uncharacterized membrane protein